MLRRLLAPFFVVVAVLLSTQNLGALFHGGIRADGTSVIIETTGQSNDVGATDQSVLPAHLQTVDSMVKVWTVAGWATLQNGVNGSNLDYPTAAYPTNPPQNWGPEAEFIYQYRLAHPNTTVYLIKHAYGGIPLCSCVGDGNGGTGNWDPASVSNYFDQMEAYVASARAALPAGVPVIALLFMQGEQDAAFTVSGNAYATNIAAFNTAVASRWGAPQRTVIGRVRATGTANVAVRAAQVGAASPPNIMWVNTDSYPLLPDGIHFTATGQVNLGGDMYTAITTGANVP